MKLSLLFVFSFFVLNISGQSAPPPPTGGPGDCIGCPPPLSIEIHFNFDQAGNQIKRYSPYAKSAVEKEVVAEAIEDDEELENTNLLEYFPNPVENELTLSWTKSINTNVKSIQIYSLDSKLVKKFTAAKNTQEHRMSLGQLASGVYIIKVSFDNGKQESFKIIKN